jgi:hypothetical protein
VGGVFSVKDYVSLGGGGSNRSSRSIAAPNSKHLDVDWLELF